MSVCAAVQFQGPDDSGQSPDDPLDRDSIVYPDDSGICVRIWISPDAKIEL